MGLTVLGTPYFDITFMVHILESVTVESDSASHGSLGSPCTNVLCFFPRISLKACMDQEALNFFITFISDDFFVCETACLSFILWDRPCLGSERNMAPVRM